jgi:integrase
MGTQKPAIRRVLRLEAFRAFFRFVHESGWIPMNPASHLKPPKITDPPTAPFTREEVASILKACDIYPDKANGVRLRALILLLRYSGVRIRDAVTLIRNRIQDDKLFLYTAKRSTAVYCPLPPFVVETLNAIPASAYFLWSGLSKPKSAVGDWQRSLKRLLILAGVPDGHAHRFRDTFRWNSCLRACRLSALQFSWVIKVCAFPKSITRCGFGRGRSNWRPTFGALGRPTNLNKGYTAGTRRVHGE